MSGLRRRIGFSQRKVQGFKDKLNQSVMIPVEAV